MGGAELQEDRMSDEVLIEFENSIDTNEASYIARALGRERADGLWEGWIDFEAPGGEHLATERETTQPNHHTLKYWATGLTYAYLEGALARAISHRVLTDRWNAPLQGGGVARDHTSVVMPRATAVLDPFAVYAMGADLLRDQLGALHGDQLRNIIRAHDLSSAAPGEVDALSEWEMRALILQAVERRAG
jgi:hypothetical protein